MRWPDVFDREILVVTGKGGTGKSTVAAALAVAAANAGRRVLLTEVEGRREIRATLGVSDPGYQETAIGERLSGLSITPHEAATEYLRLFFGLDRISRAILRAGVVDQLVGFVPGFRDLLLAGKLYEITHLRRHRARGRALYDLVVVDGPPTGQITSFLTAPTAFAQLVKVGRMHRQASAIDRMLRERASIVLVAVLEEMAVTETVEALPRIAETGVPVSAIVANRRHRPVVSRGERAAFDGLSPPRVAAISAAAGLSVETARAEALLADARRADVRAGRERRLVRTLAGAGPLLDLPDVAIAPTDRENARVARLADVIARQEAVAPVAPTPRPSHRRRGRAAEGTSLDPEGGAAPAEALSEHLGGARVVVVCGSGGVGKTTVSAALAVAFAVTGADTALLTVDPARRLATAMRLPMVAGERTRIPLGRGRRLDAMQLDTQRTFDELIERYAGSVERRDRILSNRFYRRLSNTLTGTHEYMAMEKLFELAAEEEHDAIVIDTPPTRSALSFLDAPNRVTDFLGGRLIRWLMWPGARAGRMTLGVARLSATAFARTAGRLVGAQALEEIADFLGAFEGMYGGFKERAGRVLELLRSAECVFVVVGSPTAASLEEAGYFLSRLREGHMRAGAVVGNRWLGPPAALDPATSDAAERLARGSPEERAVASVLRHAVAAEPARLAQAEALRRFSAHHPSTAIVLVPELAGDVHDLAGLRRVAEHLGTRSLLPRSAAAGATDGSSRAGGSAG